MGNMTGIPRVIHWWWDGSSAPAEYLRFRDRWRDLHPDWSVWFWNEASFLTEFPDHLVTKLYLERSRWSPRAHEWGWKTNLARYLILEQLGGLWVDADLEPLRSVAPLLEQAEREGANALAAREDWKFVNNAFIGSAPGGQFIRAVVDGLPDRVAAKHGKPSNVATGPHYLTELAGRVPGLLVLDQRLIYPMHWSELERRGENFPDAYTVHHWHRKTTEQTSRAGHSASETQSIPTRPGTNVKPAPRPVRAGRSIAPRKGIKMAVPSRIRKLPGLTPENVALTLADLATQVPADRAIVELGVYQGRTALHLAWGARQGFGAHVYAYDPWDLPGDRGPYDQNPAGGLGGHRKAFTDPGTRRWAQYNVKALGYANHVTLVRSFSVDAAGSYDGPSVGLLFVDGDHRYDAVRQDIVAWTPHLADGAVIAFDDHADTHPEVVKAVADMVAEGILEPVKIYHDRLAVTWVDFKTLAGCELEQMPEVRRAEEARQELADAILTETDIRVPRGGIQFPLPDAVEGDSTEREHPGTGVVAEPVEATPDGTEHVLTVTEQEADRQAAIVRVASALEVPVEMTTPVPEQTEPELDPSGSAPIPPDSGRPVEPAGKTEPDPAGKGRTVSMTSSGHHPVDDANLPLSEWAVPGELGLSKAVRLTSLRIDQLKRLAKERDVVLGRDGKVKPVALAKLRRAAR